MFVPLTIGLGSIVTGYLFYRLADSYFRRYAGFNSMNHDPMFIPGTSSILVCVLGWGGCTRRQLRHILDFYSSHGIATVSWISPMYDYLFGIDRKQVERVLDLILLQKPNINGIVIHLHSNNGTLVCAHLMHLIQTDSRYKSLDKSIKGIIFDSAPFAPLKKSSDWILPLAIGTSRPCVGIILNRPQYFHWFWTPLVSFYLVIRFVHRRYFLPHCPTSTDRIREFLHDVPTDIVQYYLYSDADRLIPSRSIEQVIAMETARGVSVYSHRFDKTGHVNHFRFHPDEYGKLILNFLQTFRTRRSSLSNVR